MWYFASDLHVDHSDQSYLATARLATSLARQASSGDVLILCGDYGNCDEDLARCLGMFHAFPGRKFAIPGNHDVWVPEHGSRTSVDRYNGLPQIFTRQGFQWLDGEPVEIDGIGLVGSMGWYDASFRDEALGIEGHFYDEKRDRISGEIVWNDARYARWGVSDAMVAAWQLDLLKRSLERVSDMRRVVVATHHLPTQKLLIHPRFVVPTHWRFANAFLGSERMGDTLRSHANVELVVSGHVHLRRKERIGNAQYLTVGSDDKSHDLICWDGTSVRRQTFSGI